MKHTCTKSKKESLIWVRCQKLKNAFAHSPIPLLVNFRAKVLFNTFCNLSFFR